LEIEKKVKTIILNLIEENNLGTLGISKISSSTSLTDDLNFDSLNLAQLTVMIEAEFDVDIFDKKIVRTFGEIIETLK